MTRSPFRLVALTVVGLTAAAAPAQPDAKPVSRIAFGSCADQDQPLPIFDSIAAARPDLLLMLGDNIYSDIKTPRDKVTPAVIEKAYQTLAANPGWQRLRAACPVLAVWDDHDYGINDAGEEWKFKDESKDLFLKFFDVPADSPRRTRKGLYASAVVGPPGKRVQVILLDTRYFRSPAIKMDKPDPANKVRGYVPNTDPAATVLGAEQWKWLEERLKEPAELRLVCSSIQVVVDDHPFEKWGNFPLERDRLFKLIRDTGANGVVVLSGDRHLGDLSADGKALPYPLYDLTSSGLNQGSKGWRAPEPNKYRVGGMPWGDNFGLVTVDWSAADPLVSLQLRDVNGEVTVRESFPLSLLRPKTEVAPAVPLAGGAITAREALKRKTGDAVTVQFEVKAGRKTPARFFLNSETDFRSEDNFTVLIVGAALKAGKWKDAQESTFKGKTVRVQGVLSEFNGKLQLQVEDEGKLEVVGK